MSVQKVIWITGASSGIGAALAQAYSQKGYKLILSARREDELKKVKNRCGVYDIALLPFDLMDTENAKNHVNQAIEKFGKVDILINNGGISQRSLIIQTPLEVDRKIMEVDYFGQVALTKALLPHFIQKKSGQFVVVTSVMGKYSSPYRSGYNAAKHALHGFFDALKMEHEKDGVKVTLICPGFVQTQVSVNALTEKGKAQGKDDEATQNGMPAVIFAKKMIRAIAREKHEVYIGGKEVLAVYIKRFFPKLLHKIVSKSKVR